jgi:uncharacterized protein (DUF1778 family)
MSKPAATKSESLSLRVPPDIREGVVEAARAERRPLSHLITNVLADYLAQRSSGAQQQAGAHAGG